MNRKIMQRLAAVALSGTALVGAAGGTAFAAVNPSAPDANQSAVVANPSAPASQNTTAGGGIHPQDVVYTTQYQRVSTQDYGPLDGHWVHCAHVSASPYVSHPNCNQNQTVSTTYSGSVPVGFVSGTMGFQVQQSAQYGKGITFDVPANRSGYLDVGVRFESYLVGFQHRQCQVRNNSCGGWSSTEYVNVQKFLSTTYIFHSD